MRVLPWEAVCSLVITFLVAWVLVVPGYWQLFLFTLEELLPIIQARMMDVHLWPQRR